MARLVGKVPLAPTGNLTPGTTYQLWHGKAPANLRVVIAGFGFFNNFNSAGTPGQLTFNFASTAGTGGTAITPVADEQDAAETFQSSWLTQPGSPASGLTALRQYYINPQLGQTEYFPMGREIILKGSGILVVTFTPEASCGADGWLDIEE